MNDINRIFRSSALVLALCLTLQAQAQLRPRGGTLGQPSTRPSLSMPDPAPTPPANNEPRTADYIVAVVNQELVTSAEVQARVQRIKAEAARGGPAAPPDTQLRKLVLDGLIDERVQLSYSRDSGTKVDPQDIDRAVGSIAAQNQLSPDQLRERLREEGIDYLRFRNNLRDQLLLERVREREVQQRIRITDAEIDAYIAKQRAAAPAMTSYNIAQVLVTVPEGASDAVVAERKAKAEQAVARARAGEPFDVIAKAVSEDGNRERGGEIGLRPADRLPEVFVAQVKNLKPGEIAPELLRTSAGWHALKLLDKRESGGMTVVQTRARHILLRPSAQLSAEAALQRLNEFKQQIASGQKSFEQLARENSEDGSAPQGGDLGWASPGMFVPEFEEAMGPLSNGGLSDPFISRFGAHLVQVTDRRTVPLDVKQQRDQARAALREQKYEAAYAEWTSELRARAYVEMREPPQ